MDDLKYPFYYGEQGKMFSFVRIPKVLFENPDFDKLSLEAKLLYGIFLDRMQLSAKRGWMDPEGRVYIHYTVDKIRTILKCSNKTVAKVLAELDDVKGIGLISRHRQGLGRPDRIYVHQCTRSQYPDYESMDTDSNSETSQMEAYQEYSAYFRERLGLDALCMDHPERRQRLEEILDLIVETMCSTKETIRIGGEERNAALVKSRFMKLDMEHVRYVLQCMEQNPTDIRNIRLYLLTSLYNAPMTISNYYSSRVNHDRYNSS